MDLIRPTTAQILHLGPGRLTEAGRNHPYGEAFIDLLEFSAHLDQMGGDIIAGAASFSDYLENKILEHVTGKAELAKPTFYLALCTAAPTDASTGSTITEANYTGYARLKVEAASWGTASGGVIKNSAKLEFGACTAGSSVIKGWAGCDASTTGNALVWGTVTETTISTTQTPATVAANGLEITQD